MSRFEITSGIQKKPLRAVFYGPEGIGKSTLAASMPNAVFIDVEDGTNQLPVARLPKPTSWTMLMNEVTAVRDGEIPSCGTLVIDTADAAEVLCVRHVCAKFDKKGVEDFGYGKGYTYVEEEYGRLLDLLSEVVEHGHNVVMLSHAIMRKFERPDETGAYDRFELKLSKKVAPKVKEWCDMLLFLDYKTYVTIGENKKAKASGGSRVIKTTHSPVYDAKNRFGLPDEMPLDAATSERVAGLMVGGEALPRPERAPAPIPVPEPVAAAPTPAPAPAPTPEPAPAPAAPATPGVTAYPERLSALASLMTSDGVTDNELRTAVSTKGYFPYECKVEDYPQEFVDWMVSVWGSFMQLVSELRDVPFDAKK